MLYKQFIEHYLNKLVLHLCVTGKRS